MKDLPDAGPSSVVARADALMQRRRQSSGWRGPEAEDLPVLTEIVDPDQELPVLGPEAAVPPEPAAEAPTAIDPGVLDILAHELARRMHERLAAELPDLVGTVLQATLSGLTQDLKEGLVEITEKSIRDFLAERERLAKLQQQR